MTVVSISLNDSMLSELDSIKEDMGYSGRSEVMRAAARMLIDDYRHKKPLEGIMSAVIIAVHVKRDDVISIVKHKYEEIISTQIHNHSIEKNCIDIFILNGRATMIKEMYISLHSSNKMDYISMVSL